MKSNKKSAVKKTPTSKSMDVYAKLMADHRKVEKLFKKVLKTETEDVEERKELFNEINTSLSAHAEAEEKVFYPVTADAEKTKDLTLEAYEEHKIAKTLLAELEALDPSDDVWSAKMQVLSEMIKHHVKEEEEELFPKAKKVIESDRAKTMAVEIEEVEEEVKPRVANV